MVVKLKVLVSVFVRRDTHGLLALASWSSCPDGSAAIRHAAASALASRKHTRTDQIVDQTGKKISEMQPPVLVVSTIVPPVPFVLSLRCGNRLCHCPVTAVRLHTKLALFRKFAFFGGWSAPQEARAHTLTKIDQTSLAEKTVVPPVPLSCHCGVVTLLCLCPVTAVWKQTKSWHCSVLFRRGHRNFAFFWRLECSARGARTQRQKLTKQVLPTGLLGGRGGGDQNDGTGSMYVSSSSLSGTTEPVLFYL